MGKLTPSAPQAPDPNVTAQAQTASNKETALYNFGLNNPNVVTPLGSSTYTQTAGQPSYDTAAYDAALQAWKNAGAPNGSSVSPGLSKQQFFQQQFGADEWQKAQQNGLTPQMLSAWQQYQNGTLPSSSGAPKLSDFMLSAGGNPQYTQNITLSPEQQKLYDQQTQQSIDLSNLASQLQGRVGSTLNQPLPTSQDINTLSKNAQDAYYANQTQYLDPQFENQKKQMDAALANQGITQGSEAYNNAQDEYGRQKLQAYSNAQNNAIQYGPQNAQQLFALNTAQRSEPLNEFNALRTGSQVQMPSFGGVNTAAAQPTNVMQAYQNQYQGQLNNYNQQLAANNSLTSGLFGLGGSLGAAYMMAPAASDRRLKTHIERIGETKSGIPVYRFKYIGADKIHIGVMSDEVGHIPNAVHRMPHGFDVVDYARLS